MGYIKRIILINSANYQYAEINVDGHCDMAGAQGAGKTTLLNAVVFPFVVEDQYMNIPKDKMRFSDYYFQYENSFIVYEVINNMNAPYCILVNRVGQALYFHFIKSEFKIEWIYDNDEQVSNWPTVRTKLESEGTGFETVYGLKNFNAILLGKGDSYKPQYSIIRTPENHDVIRRLISLVFKNKPFTQECLKDIMAAAVESSTEVEMEGIKLDSHRNNLAKFEEKYSDIVKMTVKDKDGNTKLGPIINAILSSADKYYQLLNETKSIPGELSYAVTKTNESIKELTDKIKALEEEKSKKETAFKEKNACLHSEKEVLLTKKGGVKAPLEEIECIEKKLEELNINPLELIQWVDEKAKYKKEKDSLVKRYNELTKDSPEIKREMENACTENKQLYENQKNIENDSFNKLIKEFNDALKEINKKADNEKRQIDKKYSELLGNNWRETELNLIDELTTIAAKLSTAETIDEIRDAVKKISISPDIEKILSNVLLKRNGSNIGVKELKQAIGEAKNRITSEIDKKNRLEHDKTKEQEDVAERKQREINALMQQEESVRKKHFETLNNIDNEYKIKDEEIKKAYEAKMYGNDNRVKEALESITKQIEAKERILKTADDYIVDAIKLKEKEKLQNQLQELNKKISLLSEEIIKIENEHTQEEQKINFDISSAGGMKSVLTGYANSLEEFYKRQPEMKEKIEKCTPIENEQTIPNITRYYENTKNNINELQIVLPNQIQTLRGMMSETTDVFSLWTDSDGNKKNLYSFEVCLGIADCLRVRMENDEMNLGLDNYIKNEVELWKGELTAIKMVMDPIQNMLKNMQKYCTEANKYFEKNNQTNCIDELTINIEQETNSEIINALRDLDRFIYDNEFSIGYDSLFLTENDAAKATNRDAVKKLGNLSRLLDGYQGQCIPFTSLFNIRINVTEKGTKHGPVYSFDTLGSNGTSYILKVVLIMTLLRIFMSKKQAENSKLICSIDEMGTIDTNNLKAIAKYGTATGMNIIFCGTDHKMSGLDYSYNIYGEKLEDGTEVRQISLDAIKLTDEEKENNGQNDKPSDAIA